MLAELGLTIHLFGVAKGEERKPGSSSCSSRTRTAASASRATSGLHLIQAIRDEAHRFAITGHRARRGKARMTSSLEDIAGIGAKRRKALLAHFGGLQGVMRRASTTLRGCRASAGRSRRKFTGNCTRSARDSA